MQVSEPDHFSGQAGGDAHAKTTYCGGLGGTPGARPASIANVAEPPHLTDPNLHVNMFLAQDRPSYVCRKLLLGKLLDSDIEWHGDQDVDDHL